MGKYRTNLIESAEKMNNTFKWFIIAIAAIIGIAILIYGIRSATQHMQVRQEVVVVHRDTVASGESDAQLTSADPISTNEPQQQAPAAAKKKTQLDNVKYMNTYNGFEINGVIIERGKEPVVYLRKEGKTDAYRVGDNVEDMKVESIHRNHIILKRGGTTIHLNNVN